MHWRLLSENIEKEFDREQERSLIGSSSRTSRKDEMAQRQKKRNLDAFERIPHELEQGVYRCPRRVSARHPCLHRSLCRNAPAASYCPLACAS